MWSKAFSVGVPYKAVVRFIKAELKTLMSWASASKQCRKKWTSALSILQSGSGALAFMHVPRQKGDHFEHWCRLANEVSSGRRLRSANVLTFVVPCMRTKLGDRSLAAAGPRLCNSLPGPLRQSETLTTFKRQFKTFLSSD